MAERDEPSGPELDDWFVEQETFGPVSGVGSAAQGVPRSDDWLSGDEPVAPSGRRGPVSTRTLVLGALLAVVLLVIGLAAGGVFSGGGAKHPLATTITTTPRQTTTPRTTRPSAVVPAPTTTLKPGDKGVQVRRLQGALKLLGYPPGTVDGLYGPATAGAVSNFQRAHKLTVDGILGPVTLAALKSALAARQPTGR
jgi:hypothetical protein